MHWRAIIHSGSGKLKRYLFGFGAAFLLVWFVFLDSHSLLSRIQWHREHARLERENAEIKAEIEELQSRLSRPLTDEEVERIAREDYGMSRSGEVVYPVVEDR